ncbi:MAG TPA: DUF488 domain-containing protein [Candidatus Mediterraneibacter surreyensis]|nr:DUF488 domain-containing protein [Candidatus Mediterraneibacter surreyensis]
MGLLYTIGHSRYEFEYFANLLKKFEINYLLDVRSTPYSKYAETFNREQLENSLASEGITYFFMGKFFGARPDNTDLYSKEGYLDFEKTSRSDLFITGMENVKLGLKKGNNIVLMCTEKDPIDCHRAIMVARAFSLEGIDVQHILPDGKLQTQQELDRRLLDRYFPDRTQLSLFDYNDPVNDEEIIKSAYRKRNKEIGYHLE